MKKVIMAVVLLMLVFLPAGGVFAQEKAAASTPESVVKTFYTCLQNGDIMSIKPLVSESIIKQVTDNADPKTIGGHLGVYLLVTAAIKEGKLTLEMTDQNFKIEESTEKSVTIVTTYNAKVTMDGKTESDKGSDKVKLVKENDKWVILELQDLTRK
ncbi:MAG: hypothetical protein LWY06_04005 [Firmicutes bacterium]|nr:hypothetical protein [Bacillota bacterium]